MKNVKLLEGCRERIQAQKGVSLQREDNTNKNLAERWLRLGARCRRSLGDMSVRSLENGALDECSKVG